MDKIIKRLSPLTEATIYTLIALIKPLHGYGIIKEVEALTDDRLRLAPGTLYGVLSTLQRNKLITLLGEEGESKKKKIYQITNLGRDLLAYEQARMKELISNLDKGLKNNG